MIRRRIVILCSAFIVAALIVWHDLPIELPGIMFKVFMLFLKLFAVVAVTIFAVIFSGGKRKSS